MDTQENKVLVPLALVHCTLFTHTLTHLYFMPVCFPVDSLSEMWRGVKEPKLRAMMATVRNLALAWLTTLGLVALCLLWSPLPLFRLWSVQAMDTCMAGLQSGERRGKLQTGQGVRRGKEPLFDSSAQSLFGFSSSLAFIFLVNGLQSSVALSQMLPLHVHHFVLWSKINRQEKKRKKEKLFLFFFPSVLKSSVPF